ncbi:MAG: hypothetical protein ABIH01_04555 [Candidatus Omnitrophota bacterium]
MKPFKTKYILLLAVCHLLCASGLIAEEIFTYDAKGKRDPFMPLVTKEGRIIVDKPSVNSIEDVKLDAIIWDVQGKSLAMINGEVVAVGELIGDFNVAAIDSDSITLEIDAKEYKIYIEQ